MSLALFAQVVGKVVYVEKPVEKVVYVEKPVEKVGQTSVLDSFFLLHYRKNNFADLFPLVVEKVVYVDKPVEKVTSTSLVN